MYIDVQKTGIFRDTRPTLAAMGSSVPPTTPDPVPGRIRLSMSDLRRDLAASLRRAEAGERIVVTVDGRPVAQLGPVGADEAVLTLDHLLAVGLITAAERPDHPDPLPPTQLPVDVRVDSVIDDLRGER